MLTSALGANCILGANPGAEDLIEGDAIQVNLLPWAYLKQSLPQELQNWIDNDLSFTAVDIREDAQIKVALF